MTCTRINQLGQCIDIGTNEFLQATMFQDVSHDFVLVLELLQHFLRGDILPCLGLLGLLDNLEFIEQNFTHLFGRSNIELLASEFINTLLDFVHTSSKLLAGFC